MFQLKREIFHNPFNYVIAIGSELLSPVFRLAQNIRIRQSPTPPQSWRRCLILGDNHIGDTLYRTCSLPALKKGLPDCDFYYLTTPLSAQLLENNPYLKAVLPFSCSDFSGHVNKIDFHKLQKIDFDSVLITNPTKYWPDLLFSFKLKISNRAGYIHKGFSSLVTHPIHIDFPQSFPVYIKSFVAQLTNQTPDWNLQPEIYPTPPDQQEADQFYQSLDLPPDTPLIACFITSRQIMADWGTKNYVAALSMLYDQAGLIPILFGTEEDRQKLVTLKEALPFPAHVAAGRLSLRSLVLFLRKCIATLCLDSGSRHLANAARIPVYYFRNLASHEIETGDYCCFDHDLTPNGSYYPVSKQWEILSTISPHTVGKRILTSLIKKSEQ
jgi:ADP-heptose:LPS heptosyltransferase